MVAVNLFSHMVYVADGSSHDVYIIDGSNHDLIANITTGGEQIHFQVLDQQSIISQARSM